MVGTSNQSVPETVIDDMCFLFNPMIAINDNPYDNGFDDDIYITVNGIYKTIHQVTILVY